MTFVKAFIYFDVLEKSMWPDEIAARFNPVEKRYFIAYHFFQVINDPFPELKLVID